MKKDVQAFAVDKKTKIQLPLSLIASLLGVIVSLFSCTIWLTWYGTRLYDGVLDRIVAAQTEAEQAKADCMSKAQFQNWVNTAVERNRPANGSVIWPPIPSKEEEMRTLKE